jgi:hypothetical protein
MATSPKKTKPRTPQQRMASRRERLRALADSVLVASGQLSQHADALFESVDTFLAGLRDAA